MSILNLTLVRSTTYFFKRYIFCADFLLAYSPQFDVEFYFKTEDAIGRHIYKTGTYEKSLTDYVTQKIPFQKNDVFIDIGANIGWYSIIMSKILPSSCKIFSFEPDPLNLEILSKNKDQNQCDNIDIIPKALGKESSESTLYLYPDKNRGRHSLIPLNRDQDKLSVEVVSLDAFLLEQNIDLTRIRFLKIDIEGFELPALQGAVKTLNEVPYILMEFSPELMRVGGFNPGDLVELMSNFGFQAHQIQGGALEELSLIDLENIQGQADLLWTKDSLSPPVRDKRLEICPLCQSEQIQYYDHDYLGTNIDSCVACGACFMNPQYSDAYQSSFYEGYIDVDEISSLDQVWEEAHLNSHQYHFQEIEAYIKPGKLLAFGCGNGRELQVAIERGWEAEGFDVDLECVEKLRKKHGVPLHTGDFFELSLEAGSFDCIYLDQVLEHLKEPAQYLNEFSRLLAPGGVLFLAVPNIKSVASRWKTFLGRWGLKQRRGKHYDTWHHLFYYGPKSLSEVLEKQFDFQTLATGNDAFMLPGLPRLKIWLWRFFIRMSPVWRSTFYLITQKPPRKGGS
jgi:FkbM family methyltransferase